MKNPTGQYIYLNQKAAAHIGVPENQIIGKTDHDFFEPELAKTREKQDYETIATQKPFVNYFQMESESGETRHFEIIKTPMYSAENKLTGVLGIERDITHRKQLELQQLELEKQLQQTQKMEAIGTLAGGIAHDFNNILSAIIGYSQMVLEELPENKPVKNMQLQVIKAGNRAKKLVQQILVFSRQTDGEVKPIQLYLIVRESLDLLRGSIPATIEIKAQISKEPFTILADATRIQQLIMNICTNAVYALKERGGIIKVNLQVIKQDAENTIRLEIEDNGNGIRPEIMNKIFDPYFTTKPVGEGSGLGLAVVKGVVEKYHGSIHVESADGKGTKVTVDFPATEQDAAENKLNSTITDIQKGSERILLIDDEEVLLEMLKERLKRIGYKVHGLTNPTEAWEHFKDNRKSYDIIITDMTMPELTGLDLIEKIRNIDSDIPIILCSGYSDILNKSEKEKEKYQAFLDKPIAFELLVKKIQELVPA